MGRYSKCGSYYSLSKSGFMIIILLFLVFLGILAGIIGAVLGLGGGIVIVPVLTFLFDMPIHNAIGISLVVITANSMSNSAVYLKSGEINMNLGILLSTAAAVGALIGGRLVVNMPQHIVMRCLGCVLILMAYLTYLKVRKSVDVQSIPLKTKSIFYGEYIDKATDKLVQYNPVRVTWNILFGFLSGIFSGISGAGGGALTIPGMNLISNIPIKAATATSVFIIGFTAAAGSIIFIQAGKVQAEVVCSIILGVIIGTKLSMRYFSKITDKRVSFIIIFLLLFVAFQMLYKGFNNG